MFKTRSTSQGNYCFFNLRFRPHFLHYLFQSHILGHRICSTNIIRKCLVNPSNVTIIIPAVIGETLHQFCLSDKMSKLLQKNLPIQNAFEEQSLIFSFTCFFLKEQPLNFVDIFSRCPYKLHTYSSNSSNRESDKSHSIPS